MRCQRRPPVPVDGPTEARAASARGQRCVDNVWAVYIMHTARVVGVLKAGADQNFRYVLAKINGSIAVVDVEIQYGHPAHVRASNGIDGRDGHAVEQAKPHRSAQLRMVSRWPHRAEDPVRLSRQHVGHTLPDGSGGIQGSVKAFGPHPGVRVQGLHAVPGPDLGQSAQIARLMGVIDQFAAYFGRRMQWVVVGEPATLQSQQQVPQSIGPLRMA